MFIPSVGVKVYPLQFFQQIFPVWFRKVVFKQCLEQNINNDVWCVQSRWGSCSNANPSVIKKTLTRFITMNFA